MKRNRWLLQLVLFIAVADRIYEMSEKLWVAIVVGLIVSWAMKQSLLWPFKDFNKAKDTTMEESNP